MLLKKDNLVIKIETQDHQNQKITKMVTRTVKEYLLRMNSKKVSSYLRFPVSFVGFVDSVVT